MDSGGRSGPGGGHEAEGGSIGLIGTPPELRFDQFTQLARRLLFAPAATFEVLDVDRVWLKSHPGLATEQLARSGSFCDEVVDSGGPLVVQGGAARRRFGPYGSATDDVDLQFYAGVPVRGPTGAAIGALAVMDTVARELSTFELDALLDLALMVESELGTAGVACLDELTGLFNSEAFERIGDWLLEFNCRRHASSLVVCSALDDLAALRRSGGSEAADRALAAAARVLRSSVRGSDVLGRVGRGQIGALLVNASVDEFPIIHKRIADSDVASELNSELQPAGSLQFGLAERDPGSREPIAALLRRARQQLLTADPA